MSSPGIKNIPLVMSGKSLALVSPTRPTRGAFRDRHVALGGAVMDAGRVRRFFMPDEALSVYGQVVWSWRRDAGAKSAGGIPPVTVTTSPLHRGEHEVSRKAIAQGMSECFRSPVCSCAPNAQFLAHETAGAACTRHSLRPLFREGQMNLQTSGETCREIAKSYPSS